MTSGGFYEYRNLNQEAEDADRERELQAVRERGAKSARRAATTTTTSNASTRAARVPRSTRGLDVVEETRRALSQLRATSEAPAAATRGMGVVEDTRRQLAEHRAAAEALAAAPTQGLNAIEEARRELAEMIKASTLPTHGLEFNERHERNLQALEAARALRRAPTGKVDPVPPRRECLNKALALQDLEKIQANGGVKEHIKDGMVEIHDGRGNSSRMALEMIDKMVEHATRGCVPGDSILPCANCAEHF